MFNFKSIPDLLTVFPTEQSIINYLEKKKWDGNAISPYDPASKVYKCANNWYKCKNTKRFFNVKTGTMFARSKLPLQKWFLAFYLFSAHKKSISSCQLARDLNITQKSSYLLLKDLRKNLKQTNFIKDMLKGSVEVDETFIGGKNKNRHWDKKVPNSQGRSWKDKEPILVMIERNGKLIALTVPNTQQNTLEPIINSHIKKGSNVYTDEWYRHSNLAQNFNHQITNHSIKQYVNGKASTNTAENFNSHLKRTITGTYHWVSKKHSQGYMNEVAFRYNTRKYSEQERFDLMLSSVLGKSLSYRELTPTF
ncbi:IS1595 family transposase [endosymbiont GvMRE of Glomus versiforme]|uniref:IS1595 family transposase n=1 Tax=endosymbiont GvMRE of Glomus versiforme TaxID=2039283 RepID=UPI000ED4E972|nr:IS1595 family transposase [endosymbiont GvMRE of Glomus versiforme]RHZ37350.1 Transposase [endosymbiont GvMRE of Glomus versiforme]